MAQRHEDVPRVDLHTHTYYSDGRPSPRELVEAAAERGLAALAITDHDNTRGNREAIPHALELGIELIPAMEFSGYWRGYTGHGGGPDIDILGYFLDFDSPDLAAFEIKSLAAIAARAEACSAYLCARGVELSAADIARSSPHYAGFLPIANAIVARHDIEFGDAMKLVDGAWKSTGDRESSLAEIIATIHAAGGVAVLAHPSIIHSEGVLLEGHGLEALVEMGLDGIEIEHYRLSDEQRAHFSTLAKRFGLIETGGSDEHGWPAGFPTLGREPVDMRTVEALRERARSTPVTPATAR